MTHRSSVRNHTGLELGNFLFEYVSQWYPFQHILQEIATIIKANMYRAAAIIKSVNLLNSRMR